MLHQTRHVGIAEKPEGGYRRPRGIRPRLEVAALALPLVICCAAARPAAQAPVPTEQSQVEARQSRLQELATRHPAAVHVFTYGRSAGGRPLVGVRIDERRADLADRSALLLTAGWDGADKSSEAMLWDWVGALLDRAQTDAKLKELLEKHTIYVLAAVNPDAHVQVGSSGLSFPSNEAAFDEDLDGDIDEDAPVDIDNDGVIRQLRVRDPSGSLALDPAESQLLTAVQPGIDSAESRYSEYLEGRDVDHDGKQSEDGRGGTWPSINFPQGYPWFAPNAGNYPGSAPETRALMQFVVAHQNIALALDFGQTANLASACASLETLATSESTPTQAAGPSTPATAYLSRDAATIGLLGAQFRNVHKLAWTVPSIESKGSFTDWLYYHRGILAISTPYWSMDLQLAADSLGVPGKKSCRGDAEAFAPASVEPKPQGIALAPAAGDGEEAAKKSKDEPARNRQVRAFYHWALAHDPGRWSPWHSISHPDFPGKDVSVGGWRADAWVAPPAAVDAKWKTGHLQFLDELVAWLPAPELRSATVKALGNGLYEVTAQVRNPGNLSYATQYGEESRLRFPLRVVISSDPSDVVGGEKYASIPNLEGADGQAEVKWTIRAGSRKKVTVQLMHTGKISQSLAVTLSGKAAR